MFVHIKIVVELLFYNDIESLKRLLSTISEHVYKIIAVDGRHWLDHKNCDISTDGSRELLSSYNNVILTSRHDFEWNKRQYVCNLCRANNFTDLLIVDSDEYAKGDWEVFKDNWEKVINNDESKYGLYKAQIQRLDDPTLYNWQPILWHRPWEFKYQNRHDYFKRDSDELVYYIKAYENVEGIVFNHDHSLRSKDHQKIRENQLEWQKTQRSLIIT